MTFWAQGARLRSVAFGLSVGLLILGIELLLPAKAALADYDPSALTPPFYSRVNSGGALVQNQGTVLDPSDALNAWDSWTGTSKLSGGSSGCGSTATCIIYANSGATLYFTSCSVQTVPNGYYASTVVQAGTYENWLGCTSIGSQSHPVFVIAYLAGSSYTHIQRHEMGHALALADTSAACWAWWVGYKPLMNNGTYGTCGTGDAWFGSNYTASDNEVTVVKSRNNW